ncbi:MAG: hypothetical protein ACOC5T_07375 [Elusimicrobiota bacterium]
MIPGKRLGNEKIIWNDTPYIFEVYKKDSGGNKKTYNFKHANGNVRVSVRAKTKRNAVKKAKRKLESGSYRKPWM